MKTTGRSTLRLAIDRLAKSAFTAAIAIAALAALQLVATVPAAAAPSGLALASIRSQTPASSGAGSGPAVALAGTRRGRDADEDWYDRGMEYHRDGRWGPAIAAFQKAIAAGERTGAATYNIACGYARKRGTGTARSSGSGRRRRRASTSPPTSTTTTSPRCTTTRAGST